MSAMTRFGVVPAITLVLLAGCSTGESTNRPAGGDGSTDGPAVTTAAAPRTNTVPVGTRIDAAITDAISSRQARVGDTFAAHVVQDVRNGGGRTVIPAGSAVHGTVTDVSPAPNARSTGTLTLAISSLTVRGKTYPVGVSIDSLDTVSEGRGIEGVDVGRVAGGAAAGAILGRVIGGNAKGTVIGGVVGGAAGAAVSVIMKDVDIVLPAGAHLMLTLRERLTVLAQ